VVAKPCGVLSVPGRHSAHGHDVLSALERAFAQAAATERCARYAAGSRRARTYSPALLLSGRAPDAPVVAHPLRAHALHRLDAATSGLLLVPTDAGTLSGAARALSVGAIRKEYEAVLDSRFTPAVHISSCPMRGR